MTIEEINQLYSHQFEVNPDFKAAYDNLIHCRRKKLKVGDMDLWVQLNPSRIKSTEAKIEKVEKRDCFLCKENLLENQIAVPLSEEWDILVNPFPIFPVHFTIVNKEHNPQAEMPLDMVSAADLNPDMAFFFNGAKSGASAPNHSHFQGILKEELPLIKEIERLHKASESVYKHSSDFDFKFPMNFVSFIIYPDFNGIRLLSFIPEIYGYDAASGISDIGMQNSIVWKDSNSVLRVLVFPRKKHRPDEFYKTGEERLAISPGAVDMAGMLITPDENTFEKITAEDIASVYQQTGLSAVEYEKWREEADRKLSY